MRAVSRGTGLAAGVLLVGLVLAGCQKAVPAGRSASAQADATVRSFAFWL